MLWIHSSYLHLKIPFEALCRNLKDAEFITLSTLNYASTYLIPRNRPPLFISSLWHEYCSKIHNSVLLGIVSHQNGILLALMIVELTIWQKGNTIAKGKCLKTSSYCGQFTLLHVQSFHIQITCQNSHF